MNNEHGASGGATLAGAKINHTPGFLAVVYFSFFLVCLLIFVQQFAGMLNDKKFFSQMEEEPV